MFHTGGRRLFSLVQKGIAHVLPVERLRHVGYSHFESANDAGVVNDVLALAPPLDASPHGEGREHRADDARVHAWERVEGLSTGKLLRVLRIGRRRLGALHTLRPRAGRRARSGPEADSRRGVPR